MIVADGERVTAFTPDGRPAWNAQRDRSHDPVTDPPPPSGERAREQILGPPVALGDGRVLAPCEGWSVHAFLMIDATDGKVRRLDAHLPLDRPLVPLRADGRTLLVTVGHVVLDERR